MNVRNNSLLLRGRVWDPSSVVSTVSSPLLPCSEWPGKAEPLTEAQPTCAVGTAELSRSLNGAVLCQIRGTGSHQQR